MKILLVDDSKSARYALRLQLQKQGAEVEMAESAEAAFEKLKGELPDAILMDHMMPGLNGFEALEVIRDDPRTAAIPVIMCTSHEEPEFVATAQKKGVFGILPKSAAPELLPEMMARLQTELSAAVSPPAPTPAPAPVAEKPAAPPPAVPPAQAPAVPPGLSEDAVVKLFESRLEERLPRLISPMVDELRRDLSEVILSETKRLIEERHTAEQSARQAAPPQPTMADLQAISTRLATETLPDLIKRAIQAERVQLQEWVDKRIGDALTQTTASEAQERSDADEIARKAVAMARRESKEAVDAALATAQQSIQSLEQRLPSLGPVYALIVLAIVLGLGAAGAVYYLLAPM
ncbi:response regulator [Allochromatium humboldtianum]|uniref:Response regulator n=1 Tax=Allochromatium humboldtianum TaxID=504901 RepID=A0A850R7P5_9GAMM|nr:response regulator [Allochromatium humboldtianum]NVZ08795.1 response regulator [Allochromatium humboldtianum]